MYRSLRESYWWPGRKRSVAKNVERCLTCLQVEIEHHKPAGTLQQIEIPVWKWDNVTMDFVTKLPKTLKGHDAIWVIVDRLTKSAHFKLIRVPIRKASSVICERDSGKAWSASIDYIRLRY